MACPAVVLALLVAVIALGCPAVHAPSVTPPGEPVVHTRGSCRVVEA